MTFRCAVTGMCLVFEVDLSGTCVCVCESECPTPRVLITSDMIWHDIRRPSMMG